jgi:hypothetical protein
MFGSPPPGRTTDPDTRDCGDGGIARAEYFDSLTPSQQRAERTKYFQQMERRGVPTS